MVSQKALHLFWQPSIFCFLAVLWVWGCCCLPFCSWSHHFLPTSRAWSTTQLIMTQLKKHRLFVYGAHYTLEDTVKNSLKGMWGPPRLSKSHFWWLAWMAQALLQTWDLPCAWPCTGLGGMAAPPAPQLCPGTGGPTGDGGGWWGGRPSPLQRHMVHFQFWRRW